MEVKEHVIRSCRYLLLPVVRFLLKHGVTWNEFGELSKEAYVKVAREDYGIEGRPTNNSRVAMLTGLSRREVARVRDLLLNGQERASELHGNQISRVLTGWHVDSEFTDENGQPKDLPATGPSGSLSVLLKRYAGDLPHGAIRKEMQQRGLIEVEDLPADMGPRSAADGGRYLPVLVEPVPGGETLDPRILASTLRELRQDIKEIKARLLELTAAYAIFPHGGNHISPYGIVEIRDRDGKRRWRARPWRPTGSAGILHRRSLPGSGRAVPATTDRQTFSRRTPWHSE